MMVCNQQATLNPVGYTIFIFFLSLWNGRVILKDEIYCNRNTLNYKSFIFLDTQYQSLFCTEVVEKFSSFRKLSTIPIAAEFELWWGNHDFGAFINSTAVYDPNFDYTVFSQVSSTQDNLRAYLKYSFVGKYVCFSVGFGVRR